MLKSCNLIIRGDTKVNIIWIDYSADLEKLDE